MLYERLTFLLEYSLLCVVKLNFPALLSFTDRKKVRETNPNEEKFSEAGGGGERPLRPRGMNPIINSTSSTKMALISNALAAYTYVSGRATFIKSYVTSHVWYTCVACYLLVISPISFFPGTERWINVGQRNADVRRR